MVPNRHDPEAVKGAFEEPALAKGPDGLSGSTRAIFGAIASLSAQWIRGRLALRETGECPDAETGHPKSVGTGGRP